MLRQTRNAYRAGRRRLAILRARPSAGMFAKALGCGGSLISGEVAALTLPPAAAVPLSDGEGAGPHPAACGGCPSPQRAFEERPSLDGLLGRGSAKFQNICFRMNRSSAILKISAGMAESGSGAGSGARVF